MPKRVSDGEKMPSPPRTRAVLEQCVAAALKADPAKGILSLGKAWGYAPVYFSKLLTGVAPAGPTVVARASLSVSPEQACELIESYLLDIVDQIEFERKRLETPLRKRGGRFDVKVSVAKRAKHPAALAPSN